MCVCLWWNRIVLLSHIFVVAVFFQISFKSIQNRLYYRRKISIEIIRYITLKLFIHTQIIEFEQWFNIPHKGHRQQQHSKWIWIWISFSNMIFEEREKNHNEVTKCSHKSRYFFLWARRFLITRLLSNRHFLNNSNLKHCFVRFALRSYLWQRKPVIFRIKHFIDRVAVVHSLQLSFQSPITYIINNVLLCHFSTTSPIDCYELVKFMKSIFFSLASMH